MPRDSVHLAMLFTWRSRAEKSVCIKDALYGQVDSDSQPPHLNLIFVLQNLSADRRAIHERSIRTAQVLDVEPAGIETDDGMRSRNRRFRQRQISLSTTPNHQPFAIERDF
jgi:hypothetical protein